MIRIPVIKFRQGQVSLFAGCIKASELCQLGVIDSWDSAKGWDIDTQGYQRESYAGHYKAIARFLSNNSEALLPTSVVLSARAREQGVLTFHNLGRTNGQYFGYLEMPEHYHLYIIDGQHRMQGFLHAINDLEQTRLNDFLVPVVVIHDIEKVEELVQFHLINDKQKRISTNLALALLGTVLKDQPDIAKMLVGAKVWKIRAITIAIALNATTASNNPWNGRIALPNEPKSQDATATLSSFVGSLEPFFSSSFSPQPTDIEIRRYLVKFWDAVRLVMPGAFRSPRQSVIQKTTGIFSMNRVAADLLLRHIVRINSQSQSMVRVLRKDTTHMVARKWSVGEEFAREYRGHARFRDLAREILALLS